MERALLSISARTRREAMDWALVLTSQGIESTIERGENRWVLLVEPREFDRAQAILRQYRLENRGWNWRQPFQESGMLFHWGGLAWAAALVAFYYWSSVRFPAISGAGMLDSDKVHQGQWWRLWTAVCLHQNVPHLVANASTGAVLMGLAMARYGAGIALLSAFVAGAAANVGSFLGYGGHHSSLGASGMVMAALGLIAVQSFSHWRASVMGRHLFFRGCAAGLMILALIGFSPEADIIAHVGGFLAGALLGCCLVFIPPAKLQHGAPNILAFAVFAALLLGTWRLALAHP